MATTDIFAIQTESKATTKAAAKKPQLLIKGETAKRYQEAKAAVKSNEGLMAIEEQAIKAAARAEWLRLYAANKRRPESIEVIDATGSSVLFIVQDKYKKVEGEFAPAIADLVQVTTTYQINPEIMDNPEYREAISKALLKALPKELLPKLFVVNKQAAIKKGAIDELAHIGIDKFDLLQPISMLK